MRIDLYLAEKGFCKSRSKAAEAIKEDRVLVNGKPVEKPSFLVEEGMEVTLLESEEEGFVSRAGYKLEGALQAFGIDVSGKEEPPTCTPWTWGIANWMKSCFATHGCATWKKPTHAI